MLIVQERGGLWGVSPMEVCLCIDGKQRTRHHEAVFQSGMQSLLPGGEAVIVAIKISIHRWWRTLFIGGRGKSAIYKGLSAAPKCGKPHGSREQRRADRNVSFHRNEGFCVADVLPSEVRVSVGGLLSLHEPYAGL